MTSIIELLVVCLLLLTLPTGWPPPVSANQGDKLTSDDARVEALLQLRELVLSGLEMQESAAETAKKAEAAAPSATGGTLTEVVAGARAFARALAPETVPPTVSSSLSTTNSATTGQTSTIYTPWTTSGWLNATGNDTVVAGIFSKGWFRHIYTVMLRVMPLTAWIAVFVVIGLIILLLLLLIVVCCFRMRSQDRLNGRYDGGGEDAPPLALKYKDLDIVGRKQPPFGVINFSVEYDVAGCTLIVTAFSCVGLPKELKSLDPYIVIRIEVPVVGKKPHQRQQQQLPPAIQPLGSDVSERSKVVKNSVNPAFNFTRIFKIKDKRLLKIIKIVFEVYDWDIGARHRMIARRILNFARLGENLNDILGRRIEYARDLQPPAIEEATGPGDICLALCYSDQEKHLWVQVIECKGVFLQNFEEPDLETIPSTYVKLCLSLAGGSKRLTKSTKLVRQSRNPYFNEQFIFKIDPIQLTMSSLRVSLVHRTETLRIKRVFGVLTLSKNVEKDSMALLHWKEALTHHDRPIARWHTLITPETERKQADRKAEAEHKKKLEEAEDEAQTNAQALLVSDINEE